MTYSFTDADVDKRVENAANETIGTVTAIDDDVAYVEPRSGVVDSIKSTLGWEGDTESVPIRAAVVDDVTDDAIRLGTGPVDQDEASIDDGEADTAADDETDTGTGEPAQSELNDSIEDELTQELAVDASAETVDREQSAEESSDVSGEEPIDVSDAEGEMPEDPTDPEPELPAADRRPADVEADTDEQKVVSETSGTPADREPETVDDSDAESGTIDHPDGETETTDHSESEPDVADALETETALESVVEDDRGHEATDTDIAEPATELNDGLDLEAVVEPDDRESSETHATESMELAETLDRNASLESAVEPDRDPRSAGSQPTPGPQPWIAGHTMLDSATAIGRVTGGPSSTDQAAVGGADDTDSETDTNRRSTPFGTLVAAQRSAMSGPATLVSQGLSIQRATAGVTASAIGSQIRLHRLGLEALHKSTMAPFRTASDDV